MADDSYAVEKTFVALCNLQFGCVSRGQLEANGVHRLTIDRRLSEGVWVNLAPAIYRSPLREPDWRMRAMAALLEGHADAVFGGRTALGFLGMSSAVVPSEPPRLLVEHRKTHDTATASVKQVIGWPESEIVKFSAAFGGYALVESAKCTTIARSLIDTGCWEQGERFPAFVQLADDAVRRRLTTFVALAESADRAHELRRRGLKPVHRWIESRLLVPVEGSSLEELAQRRFHEWSVASRVRFEVPHPAYPDSDKRADAVCDETRVIFEYDSRLFHLSESGFQNDRTRDGDSLDVGWVTRRLTWADLTRDQARTRMQVRRLCGLDGGQRRKAVA
jgi:hypothetical protein